MNTEKVVKIVLLVIMFCTLIGCSFCKRQEHFSDIRSAPAIEEGKVCDYEINTEGCIGYNCVEHNGKQYVPAHKECKTKFCNCVDYDDHCKCDNIVDRLPNDITFSSNDNDYEFQVKLDWNDKKELFYVNKNDPDNEKYEYYKYDRKNNMFVGKENGVPYTFLSITIVNIDNMYDTKIDVNGTVYSFRITGDKILSCSDKKEKLTQLYDEDGNHIDSFCFDDSDEFWNPPGPYKIKENVSYSSEKIEGDVKCHKSCKSCGFSDDPSGDTDCITCNDGDKLHPVFPDGTGKCVKQKQNLIKDTKGSDGVESTNVKEKGRCIRSARAKWIKYDSCPSNCTNIKTENECIKNKAGEEGNFWDCCFWEKEFTKEETKSCLKELIKTEPEFDLSKKGKACKYEHGKCENAVYKIGGDTPKCGNNQQPFLACGCSDSDNSEQKSKKKPFIECLDKLIGEKHGIKAMNCDQYNNYVKNGMDKYCEDLGYAKKKTDDDSVKAYMGKLFEMGGNILEKHDECPKTGVQTVTLDESDKYEVCLNGLSGLLPEMDCSDMGGDYNYIEYLNKGVDDWCKDYNQSKKKEGKVYLKQFLDLAGKKYNKTDACKSDRNAGFRNKDYKMSNLLDKVKNATCKDIEGDTDGKEFDPYMVAGLTDDAVFYGSEIEEIKKEKGKKNCLKPKYGECTKAGDCISKSCNILDDDTGLCN
jgi:hypothetical protein